MSTFTWALGIPRWVKHLPKPSDDTYYYRVTKADAKTYNDAYVRAFSMAILESQWKMGVKMDKDNDLHSIEQTINADLNIRNSTMNLPINKVCEYEQASPNGGIILYLLWQVASYGNVKPNFEPYLDCE